MQQATRAAVFLDVGNVLSDLTHPQLRNLQRHLTGPGMEGVDVYVCTRGEHRWIELLEDNKLNAFCSSVKGVMVTRYLERHAHRHPSIWPLLPPRRRSQSMQDESAPPPARKATSMAKA